MFDQLQDKLDRAFKVLKGQGKITEINVAETLKEVRKALLDADVNYKVAKSFTDRIKEKALGQQVLTAVSPGQLLIKITHDELVQLMGGAKTDLNLHSNPTVILMSGLQGSGKTTFSGKLAYHLKHKKGKKPLLVAADVYRPAAIDQLHVLGTQLEIDVFSNRNETNPVVIAQAALQHAKEQAHTVVIIDTAGRLAVDESMMQEIENLKKELRELTGKPIDLEIKSDGLKAANDAIDILKKAIKTAKEEAFELEGGFNGLRQQIIETNKECGICPIENVIILQILP